MQVSIQGVKGAFHEEAAKLYFDDRNAEVVPCISFEDLIETVKDGSVSYGIMAVENTISGTIHQNLNLIRQAQLNVCGEQYLKISQNLAVFPGSQMENLTEVRSHYMAINQCRPFFQEYPHIRLVESEDTALSIREVAEKKLCHVGAIGSDLAIKQYGLVKLAADIQANKMNYTRFLVLSNNPCKDGESVNRASISLVLNNHKGSLAKVLNIISRYDINLTKIESLPIVGEPWHYRFYIDLRFDSEEQYQLMLVATRPLTDQLDILGEYLEGKKSFNQINTKS